MPLPVLIGSITVLLCISAALAADGQYEISQALIPFSITNSGSYVFTENVTGAAGQNGITIHTNNVHIDLQGFMLQGVPDSGHGIEVPTNLFNISVANGTIANWGLHGIDAFHTENSSCAGIFAHNNGSNGIFYGQSATITDCHSFSNGETGIQVENGSVVKHCKIWKNHEHGIDVHSGSTVEDCQIWTNGHDGVHGSHAVTVTRTISDGNYGEGIEVDTGGRIMDSTARFNSDDGIKVRGEGGIIIRCFSERNGYNEEGSGDGIDLAPGGSIRDSIAAFNADEGIRLQSNCIAIANTSMGHTSGAGFKVYGPGNRIEKNLAKANKRGIQVLAPGNLIIGNVARENSSSDFIVPPDNIFRVITTPGTNMPLDPWINLQL